MYLTISKICTICNIEKEIDSRFGLYKACRTCLKKHQQKYYQNNRDLVIERSKQFMTDNPDKNREYVRKYYQTHRDSILEKARRRRLERSS